MAKNNREKAPVNFISGLSKFRVNQSVSHWIVHIFFRQMTEHFYQPISGFSSLMAARAEPITKGILSPS